MFRFYIIRYREGTSGRSRNAFPTSFHFDEINIAHPLEDRLPDLVL